MGVSISFVNVTTEELDRAEKDPSWAEQFVYELYGGDTYPVPGRIHGGPDRAFAGLQFLFDEAEVTRPLRPGADGEGGRVPQHVEVRPRRTVGGARVGLPGACRVFRRSG